MSSIDQLPIPVWTSEVMRQRAPAPLREVQRQGAVRWSSAKVSWQQFPRATEPKRHARRSFPDGCGQSGKRL